MYNLMINSIYSQDVQNWQPYIDLQKKTHLPLSLTSFLPHINSKNFYLLLKGVRDMGAKVGYGSSQTKFWCQLLDILINKKSKKRKLHGLK